MESTDYYLILRKFYIGAGEGEAVQTTVKLVSKLLHCTDRNVRYVLRKMEEEGLINWLPGKGRGRQSTLIFRASLQELLFEKAAQCPTIEDVSLLFKEMNPNNEKGMLKRWLEGQFGFQTTSQQDTLRFPFYRPIPNLDPATVHRRTESHIINQICDTLVRYNSKTQLIEPHLSHYWESNDTFTQWTFYLRKGVYFHHGKQMTAEDAAFSIHRVQKNNPHHMFAHTIETINVLKPFVFEIVLKEPNALLLHLLSNVTFSIVSNDLNELTFSQLPIGTGPFMIERNDKHRLILTAHEHYFKERAHLDRIEIWVWSDKTWQEWLNEVDHDLFLVGYSNLDMNRPTHLLNQVEKGASYLTINLNKKGPLLNPRLREAIHYGINPLQMIEELKDHRLLPASSFDPTYRNDAYINRYNLEKARDLVRASSYRGERLTLYTYISERNTKDSLWIKRQLADIGIQIDVFELPITELIKDQAVKEADLIFSGEVLNEPFDTQLIGCFESSNPFIRGHLDPNLKVIISKLLKECYVEKATGERLALLYKIEEILINHQAIVFFYHSAQMVSYDFSLKGVSLNALGNVDFNKIWVKDSECS